MNILTMFLDVHDEDHLLFKLPALIIFWAYLPVEMEQFFEGLVPRWQNILDDRHNECRLHSVGQKTRH
jgi:hypothetical protein